MDAGGLRNEAEAFWNSMESFGIGTLTDLLSLTGSVLSTDANLNCFNE